MPVRRGHVAPKTTLIETIIRKFDTHTFVSNTNYSYLDYYKSQVPVSMEDDNFEYGQNSEPEEISYCLNRTKELFNNHNLPSSDRYEVYIKSLTNLTATNLGIRNLYLHNNYNNNTLQTFDISNNLLESLSNIINIKFSFLESLDASNNVIKCIKSKLVKNWPNINFLNFSRNCLTDFPLEYFLNQKSNFTEINLSFNLLKQVKVFQAVNSNKTHIEILNLSHNLIDTMLIAGLNIKNLIVNDNKLTNFHYYTCGLYELIENREVNHFVDLSNNFLKNIFTNCAFKNLNLQGNRLENLNFLYSIKSVEVLNMSNNIMRTLFSPDHSNQSLSFAKHISSPKNMKILDLSANLLYSIRFDDLKMLLQLEHLNLEANNLKVLDYKSIINTLPSLKYLNIKHNRFSPNYKNEINDYFKFHKDLKVDIY